MHRVYVDFDLSRVKPGEELVIEGDEARHALRVKRIEPGERITALDGAGGIAEGVALADSARKKDAPLRIRVESVRQADRVVPRLEIASATPKGGRVDDMIDQLSQAGAAAWRPRETARGVADPRETKLARLERVAREASKQSGRAWVLEIGERIGFADALRSESGVEVLIADASGVAYEPSGARMIRLLVGPEGGLTSEELGAARNAGARVVRFGPHVMRIETAAVVAAGAVMGGSQA